MQKLTRARRVLYGLPAILILGSMLAASGDYRLVDAVKDRNRRLVVSMIADRADVNARLSDGSTPLAWAAYQDDTETAEILLKAGAKPITADEYGETPLTLACANGNAILTEKFLSAGADANAARWTGETALMIGAHSGNPKVVSLLLGHGAKVDAKEERKGQNALMWAASEGHSEVVAILLKAGASPNVASKAGFSPLIFATQQGDAESVASLLGAGADIGFALPGGMNALQIAVSSRKSEAAKVLIKTTPAATFKSGPGNTLLLTAAQQGDAEIVKALIASGVDVNAKTPTVAAAPAGRGRGTIGRGGGVAGEQTALMMAAQSGQAEVMRLLVTAGADAKAKAQDGTTLLMSAAKGGRVEAVKYAFELDPDVKALTEGKQTVMHAAVTGTVAKSSQAEVCQVVQFLADHGAELDATDVISRTPRLIAEAVSAGTVAELLSKLIRASGATPFVPPPPGR